MDNNKELLQYLHYHPLSSRKDISEGMPFDGSDATLKRRLATEIQAENVVVSGNNKSTRYSLSAKAQLLMPLNLDTYFAKDIDEREVQTSFNFELIREQLPNVKLFSDE